MNKDFLHGIMYFYKSLYFKGFKTKSHKLSTFAH